MRGRAIKLLFHLGLMSGITALIALVVVYPFLPGGYDGLAVALSTMAQVFGVVGLLLVPVGVLGVVAEVWKQVRRRQNLPIKGGGYRFAVIVVIAASLVMTVVAIAGAASIGLSFGLISLILWSCLIAGLLPTIKGLKNKDRTAFNFLPVYIVVIPAASLLLQFVLAGPVTQASRDHAVAMSAEIIQDIEAYRLANGSYPLSLLATWPDYSPDVIGIEQYHYVSQGEAYNLFFQQPRFLLDDFGVREFIVYNPLDEHTMISHSSWILLLRPSQLRGSQGWFAVRDASTPHWKYLWFD